MEHDFRDLIHIFKKLFQDRYETILVCGQDEPIYLPKDESCPHHRLIFAHGYFASALHEIAHWSIAGKRRRLLEDFGYWYKPESRTEQEQRQFEAMETKPQALEWIYATACGHRFQFSADNLNCTQAALRPFQLEVQAQVSDYLAKGLPNRRTQKLVTALCDHYQMTMPEVKQFQIPHL